MIKNYFNYENIFVIFPGILISLLPALLVSGPFLPDLAISIITILFLINTFKNKLYSYYKNFFFIYLFHFIFI